MSSMSGEGRTDGGQNYPRRLLKELDGYEDAAIGEHLNRHGIAVRTGHHCAQPVLRRFGQESVVRASLALYNSPDDIDALVRALRGLV